MSGLTLQVYTLAVGIAVVGGISLMDRFLTRFDKTDADPDHPSPAE